MTRRLYLLLIPAVIFGLTSVALARRPPAKEITDPKEAKADPAFSIQGEYVGQSQRDDGTQVKAGAQVITREQCMDGISEMIHDVQVEATFPDGTKLVTVHNPIR